MAGKGPAEPEAPRVIGTRRGIEERCKVSASSFGQLVNLPAAPVTPSDKALGSHGRPLATERAGGRNGGGTVVVIFSDGDDVAGLFETGKRRVERAEGNVGKETQLGSKSPTDLVAMERTLSK